MRHQPAAPRTWLTLSLAALLAMLQSARADDDNSAVADATDDAAAEAAALLDDPAFNQFVDLGLVQPAWYSQAASLLTDLALQLAEGERILGRVHKAAKAEDVARLALKAALRSRDVAALDRLAYFAEQSGNEEFLAELGSARKLGAASRGSQVTVQVPLDDLTPAQLVMYKEYAYRIDLAAMVNDHHAVARLSQDAASLADLPQPLRDALVARAKPSTSGDGHHHASADDESLHKLLHATRQGGQGGSSTSGFGNSPTQLSQLPPSSQSPSHQHDDGHGHHSAAKSIVHAPAPGYGYYSRMLGGTFVHRANFQIPGYPPFPGVRIASLDHNSPLHALGLQVGDVISRLDGIRIHTTSELDRHHDYTLVHFVRSGAHHAHKETVNLGPYITGGGGGGGGGGIAP